MVCLYRLMYFEEKIVLYLKISAKGKNKGKKWSKNNEKL